MNLKYEKSPEDAKREESDLQHDVILRWIKDRELFRFNVGDVLIRQTKWGTEWKTETIGVNETPVKYVYVFENELGIGYLKQLRSGGSGFAKTLLCVTELDPARSRLVLDPEYADHLIIGDGEFDYSADYLNKKKYRAEAIKKNNQLALDTKNFKKLYEWFSNLKVGDEYWYGWSYDRMTHYRVISITDEPVNMLTYYIKETFGEEAVKLITKNRKIEAEFVGDTYNRKRAETITSFFHYKLMLQKPFSLRDELCGPQK